MQKVLHLKNNKKISKIQHLHISNVFCMGSNSYSFLNTSQGMMSAHFL